VVAGESEACIVFELTKVRDKAVTRTTSIGEVRYETEAREILAERGSHSLSDIWT
jgi:hypothetical protein